MSEPSRKVLVVDDQADTRDMIAAFLTENGYTVGTSELCDLALTQLQAESWDLVVTDLRMPKGIDGLELLKKMRESCPEVDALMVTGHSSVETAIQALKRGAFDYLTKPFDLDELLSTVSRVFAYRELAAENVRLRADLATSAGVSSPKLVVGSSPAMRHVMNIVQAVAPMPTSVLIRGESGTGKEVVADEIHRLSPRVGGALVKVNCAALPESLLEDELFGHEKGAFTGAVAKRIGRFEEADGGTIFLDEIGELNPLLQAKLLRILQERCFQRVGSNKTIQVDIRIVCATNKDLEAAVAEGSFREDLYYRINVVQIELPPLRERREDIPALADALIRRLSLGLGIPPRKITPGAFKKLQAREFPGNIRELQNLLERLLIFTNVTEIQASDIPGGDEITIAPQVVAQSAAAITGMSPTLSHRDGEAAQPWREMSGTLAEIEREAIEQALLTTKGNMYRAAKMLDISRSTLYSKVKKLNLDPKRVKE